MTSCCRELWHVRAAGTGAHTPRTRADEATQGPFVAASAPRPCDRGRSTKSLKVDLSTLTRTSTTMYSLLKSNPFLLFSQEFQPLQGIAVCDGRLERLPQGVFLVEAKKALHPFSMDASTSWRWTWSGAFSSHRWSSPRSSHIS